MSFTKRLIELVKTYPILYDLGNPEYKDIRKKDKIWGKIGTEFNESGDEVKKKWKNLRDSYAKYLKSIKTTTGQRAKKNYRNWQWARHMEPFKPYLAFARTDSNITEPVNNIESPGEIIMANLNETDELSDSSGETNEGNNAFKDNNDETNVSDEKELQLSTPSTSKSVTRRKTGSIKACQSHSSSVKTVIDNFKNKKLKKELSPTDMIFLGYSQILQTFSPRRQAETKMKIAAIMTEQECLHLEEAETNNRAYSTSPEERLYNNYSIMALSEDINSRIKCEDYQFNIQDET